MTMRRRLSALAAGVAALLLVVGTSVVLDLADLVDLKRRVHSLAVAALLSFFGALVLERRRGQYGDENWQGNRSSSVGILGGCLVAPAQAMLRPLIDSASGSRRKGAPVTSWFGGPLPVCYLQCPTALPRDHLHAPHRACSSGPPARARPT